MDPTMSDIPSPVLIVTFEIVLRLCNALMLKSILMVFKYSKGCESLMNNPIFMF